MGGSDFHKGCSWRCCQQCREKRANTRSACPCKEALSSKSRHGQETASAIRSTSRFGSLVPQPCTSQILNSCDTIECAMSLSQCETYMQVRRPFHTLY